MTDGYHELLECGIGPVVDAAMKCEAVFTSHSHALVSVSGGADSDVMVDLVERVRTVTDCEVSYVYFDTGLEYRATKRHVAELGARYGIRIETRRAEKSIPVSCKEFGQPFLSKYVSEMCERLQRVGFQWEDEAFDVLDVRYPNCKSTLRWWCDNYKDDKGIPNGRFNIMRNRWLKEFMMANPPTFKISAKCCEYAKKHTSRTVERELGIDVTLIGVRAAEGGVRAGHKKCFDRGSHGHDTYRPLFWMNDGDRAAYAQRFNIRHSDCYISWGLRRTGCSCCPFGRELWRELDVLDMHEPNVAKAARKVFADAYEYTRRYREFCSRMRAGGQMSLF